MEWTHTQITKVVKQLIAERKIDQEIDFKIQRSERRSDASKSQGTTKDSDAKGAKMFARTG
jgi:hypothetical protein